LVEGTRTRGVCNIGLRPTFHKKKQKQTIPWPLLEAHLLDTKKNLYGKIIEVQFIERLRAEKKFSSPYLLKKQIIKDIQKARECLRTVDYHGGRHPLSFSEGNL
jgi:riboflavin kinase/FMN adenylyltransferase